MNGWKLLGIYVALTAYGSYRIRVHNKYLKKLEIEKFDTMIAMEPFVWAEKDRAYLRNIRMIRDEEREIMKGLY